jgi:hypothetical protein
MDSKYKTLVDGVIAFFTSSSLCISTKDVETPQALGRKCANSAWVPPYRHLEATTWSPWLHNSNNTEDIADIPLEVQ